MKAFAGVFVLVLAGFFIYFWRLEMHQDGRMLSTIPKIRIAFKARTSAKTFDPARIQMDTEAVVLDNLFSPLVRMANDGMIEPGLAESYRWEGNSIAFQFRRNFKTVDGKSVGASDAAFTLRRIIAADSNAHGELRTFLCPGKILKSADDNCEGIEVKGGSLVLTVVKENYKPFLLKLLVSMDFGIIPRASCDQSPVPKIVDFRNTSGPYFLEKDDEHGAFVLAANPNHWLAKEGIPQRLEFVPSEPDEALDLILAGKVDFIASINTEPSGRREALRSHNELNFFDTHPIRKMVVVANREKLSEFTESERLFIYSEIREAFQTNLMSKSWTPSIDFFPILGEGSLTKDQEEEFKTRIEGAKNAIPHRVVTVGVSKRRWESFSKILDGNKYIKLKVTTTIGAFATKEEDRVDFYIIGTDASFYESLNLISYNISAEMFDLSKAESPAWFDRYMSFEDKAKRIEMLRELNFRTLSKGITGVLGEAPYTSIARKPFRYDGSRFFAGSPLWQIRRD